MKWFIHTEGQTFGPFTFYEMAELAGEGRLSPDTNVAEMGSKVWTVASANAALTSLFIDVKPEDIPTRSQGAAKLIFPAIAMITLCVGVLTIIAAFVRPDKSEPPAREVEVTDAHAASSGVPRSERAGVQDGGMPRGEARPSVPQSSTEKACIAASAGKIPNSPGITISASRAKAPG